MMWSFVNEIFDVSEQIACVCYYACLWWENISSIYVGTPKLLSAKLFIVDKPM